MRQPAPDRLPDLAGGGLLALLGVAVAVASAGYGLFGEGSRLAPGFTPFLTGTVLAVLGAAIAARALRPVPPPEHPDQPAGPQGPPGQVPPGHVAHAPVSLDQVAHAEEGGAAPEASGRQTRTVAAVFALSAATILLTPLLGFLLAFGLLVLVLAVAVERRGLLPSAALAVGATAAVWLLFERFLAVPLPIGVLGI